MYVYLLSGKCLYQKLEIDLLTTDMYVIHIVLQQYYYRRQRSDDGYFFFIPVCPSVILSTSRVLYVIITHDVMCLTIQRPPPPHLLWPWPSPPDIRIPPVSDITVAIT